MKFEKSWLDQYGFKVTLAAALWTAACGGSAFSGAGNAGAGNTGIAGSGASGAGAGAGAGGSGAGGSHAGGSEAAGAGGRVCNVACPQIACDGVSVIKPGECCPTCEPGGGSGGVSSGGSGPVCTGACSAIGCGPGFKSVTEPGACCPTCVPDGAGGAGGCTAAYACPGVVCAKGFMSQQQAGSCCPTCVPSDTCSKGQQGYAALRQKLLAQPEVGACKVSKDCTLLSGNANCGDQCSQAPVSVAAAQSIDDELSAYAGNNCSTCTPIYPPCAAPLPPSCVQGVCAPGSYLAN